jgi:predicted nucleic acid-binding protein
MTDDLTFIDTNVLVYAYNADAGHKHQTAKSVVVGLWNSRSGAMSTQVLQEFYVTTTRKIAQPLAPHAARQIIDTYRAWPVHRPDVGDILSASELAEHHRLSFWDALIVIAAQGTGATTLLSEDLQDGRRLAGLTITNPFSEPIRYRGLT